MTPLQTFGLVVSFLASVAALITAIVKIRSAPPADRKVKAETEKTEINGQSVVIANLATEVDRLSARVTQLEGDYELLRRKYDDVLAWATPRGYRAPAHW